MAEKLKEKNPSRLVASSVSIQSRNRQLAEADKKTKRTSLAEPKKKILKKGVKKATKAEVLPSLVRPVLAVMVDGTMKDSFESCPRHSSRVLVSKEEVDLPQHNRGLPGNRRSMMASVWGDSNQTGEECHRSAIR